MEIKIEELIERVLKKLDENGEIVRQNTEFEYHGASLPDLVAMLLEEEAESVVLSARRDEIDEWEDMEGDVEWDGPGHGRIRMPADFLRFGYLRMSDWPRRVYEFMNPATEAYHLRFGKAWEGRVKSPAVAIHPGAGGYEVEFIGSRDPGAYIQRAGYLPRPRIDADGDTMRIPRSLTATLTSRVAERIKLLTNS